MSSDHGPANGVEVDPMELLRKMLAISPEDAASVREDAARATAAGGTGRKSGDMKGQESDKQ